ncbi:unnamed protein product [Rotaria sp. Silwood2]|nr:unnamed protein product [Rotaria sp. Silwood2]CAF3971992.1 unnamed protein product [Rotaria sp. Silwood2]
MDDDILEKFDQVTALFKEKFRSTAVQRQNQAYIEHLYEQLNEWKLNIDEQIRQIIEEKTNEITQSYDQYCQEINEKYENINGQIENQNLSSDINEQIENFIMYCQSNTIEKRIHLNTIQLTKNELDKKIQLESVSYYDIPLETTRIPLKTIIKERNESIHSIHSSSKSSSSALQMQRSSSEDNSKTFDHEDDIVRKPLSDRVDKESFNTSNKPTTITNDVTSKRSTKLYIGKHNTLVPVLINKNREVYNETERITEYSIDSIAIPQDQQQQDLKTIHNDNDNDDDKDKTIQLVHAYKVLIRGKTDYQRLSTSSEDEKEEKSNVNKVFNLQQFDQTNYSTVMFKKCETSYNCLSSSTQRNELLVYNSKLKVLIILKHENNKKFHHQLFIQWPKNVSPQISDITYCQNIDQFLISTYDTCHIYLFDRDLLSIYNLGKLSNDLPLRRIHCYQQTIYCILGNNYLLEFQLNDQYKNLKFIQQVKLFNPIDRSHNEGLYLLDVTCNKNYLVIIYSNEYDEIHLQSIHQQTRELHYDFIIDNMQPINQVYIRIESTNYNENFIYINGKQKILKAINLINKGNEKITSTMRRETKPTNICFLKDGRLVILYEYPYYLSVHALYNS